jgi:hypothetical protein
MMCFLGVRRTFSTEGDTRVLEFSTAELAG